MASIRKLTLDDWDIVNRFCLESPSYFVIESGSEGELRAADELFQSIPEGKTLEDKFIYGYFVGDELAGIAEGIRNHPQNGTWIIGMFIVAENLRNQSLGTDFLQQLELQLRDSGAMRFRIGVLDINQDGMKFWERSGYIRNGDIKEMVFNDIVHRVHVLTKGM